MFKILFDDVKDRLAGNKAKANARLGLVSAPQGKGKLIWLVADHHYDSVVMAAALMAAISEKRKDVRLVLTYQTEYQDVLVRHFNGLKKIGFGYGVGDNKLAVRQVVKRLSPFAVIFVGHQPASSALSVLAEYPDIHKIAFQFTPDTEPVSGFYEACYPDSISSSLDLKVKELKPKELQYVSPKFDVLTRLVQSQIDKQLGAMLCGDAFDTLFHIHNASMSQIKTTLADWKSSALSTNALLGFSVVQSQHNTNIETVSDTIKAAGFNPVRLSQWRQQSLKHNDIVIADEQKWFAALCTGSSATHLISPTQSNFWQAASSGAALTYSYEEQSNGSQVIAPAFSDVVPKIDNTNTLLQHWSDLIATPMQQRKASDAIRKIFWNERRQAETQVDELLQRIYDW